MTDGIVSYIDRDAQPQATFNLAFQNTGDPTTVSITFDCYANQDGDIYEMTFEDGTGEE